MGRYYWGDINGKFWFGIQSSTDAENFGAVAQEFYCWDCCQEDATSYDLDKINDCPNNCHECENCNTEQKCDEHTNTVCKVILNNNLLRYTLYKEEMDEIKDQLYEIAEELEMPASFVTDIIELPAKDDEDDSHIEETVQNYMARQKNGTDTVLYARLQLGLKIYSCLKSKDRCTFTAEI